MGFLATPFAHEYSRQRITAHMNSGRKRNFTQRKITEEPNRTGASKKKGFRIDYFPFVRNSLANEFMFFAVSSANFEYSALGKVLELLSSFAH